MDSIRSGRALWRSWRAESEAQEKWSEPQKRMQRGSGFCLGLLDGVAFEVWRMWIRIGFWSVLWKIVCFCGLMPRRAGLSMEGGIVTSAAAGTGKEK